MLSLTAETDGGCEENYSCIADQNQMKNVIVVKRHVLLCI